MDLSPEVTDEELSLSETVNAKSLKVDNSGKWMLHQKKKGNDNDEDSDEITDDSCIDEYEEEATKFRRLSFNLIDYFDSSTVTICNSVTESAVAVDDNEQRKNPVEEICLSIKDEEDRAIMVPQIVEHFCPTIDQTAMDSNHLSSGQLSNESDDESDKDTDDELVSVRADEYKHIMKEELDPPRGKKELSLKSHESRISHGKTTKERPDPGVLEREDTQEELDLDQPSHHPRTADRQDSQEVNDGEDSSDADTVISDIEVSMIDYYKIRHSTQVEDLKDQMTLNEALKKPLFDANSFFNAMAKSVTTVLTTDKDEPLTDESDESIEGGNDDKSLDEDEENVTAISDLEVPERDYYFIRRQNASVDSLQEYMLLMDSTDNMVRINNADNIHKKCSEKTKEQQEESLDNRLLIMLLS